MTPRNATFGALLAALVGSGCGSSSGEPMGTPTPDGGSSQTDGGHKHTGDSGGKGPTDSGKTDGTHPDSGPVSTGLHVVLGTHGSPGHIVDGSGKVVQFHGADRSGTEFACIGNYGFFDGPADQAGVDAMKAWNIDAVRVPLNEDCWLGINGVDSTYGGANYQKAIKGWVDLLTTNDMIVIVDLHWTAPGTETANAQAPMADADHSPTFWSQVATMFASNGSVIFDLFNEPFITDWGCWVSGVPTGTGPCATLDGNTYTVAGMASLLKAVRDAGANNVVIMGGLGYSSDMSQWVKSVNSIPSLPAPLDGISVKNVAASWHVYDFGSEQTGCPSMYNGYSMTQMCYSAEQTAMNTSATDVLAAGFPVVVGESGISAFSASSAANFTSAQITDLENWFDGILTWMEKEGQCYMAWSWNTDTDPVLITDYDSGAPTQDFGQTYQAHLKKF